MVESNVRGYEPVVTSSVHVKVHADLLVSGLKDLVQLAAEIRDDLRLGQPAMDQLEEKSKQRSALFSTIQTHWEELTDTDRKLINAEAGEAITELLRQLAEIDHEAGLLVEKLRAEVFSQAQMVKTQRLAHQEYSNTTLGTSSLGFFIDKKNT